MLDDLTGALVAVSVALLGIAGTMIVLATYYGNGSTVIDPAGGPQWTATLYQSLLLSSIGAGINDTLVPFIGVVLGPFLPSTVSEVFA